RPRAAGPHATGSRRVAAASPRAPAPPDAEQRRHQLLTSFSRGAQLRRCWDRAVLDHPTIADRSLAVTLHVDAGGRTVRVDVRDPQAPDLAQCLVRAGLWLPWVGPGEAFQASTTVTFNRGG
ncbi:MAG: hypothetical protein JWM10_2341, partial [Myxococcaceae bacterium]|nr:hypothetical protein [Myxococcaceae bacterium]